jgi:hypothetical protein
MGSAFRNMNSQACKNDQIPLTFASRLSSWPGLHALAKARVPAISLGDLPPLMAGTVAGHDGWVANSEHWQK